MLGSAVGCELTPGNGMFDGLLDGTIDGSFDTPLAEPIDAGRRVLAG